MRRVLFVAPSAYPLGGVAVWLNYLVRGLPAFGWEPVVGLVSGRWHDVERYAVSYPLVRWVEVRSPTGSREGRLRALEGVIQEQSPDIVVGVNIADVYQACDRVRQRGVRSFHSVMAMHGIAADLFGDLHRERNRIDAVVGTNQLTCRLCSQMGRISEDRIYYAPYGVDVPKTGVSLRRSSETGCLRIAYVGRFDNEQKRVELIPDILRSLEGQGVPFRIQVAGGGPQKDDLERWLKPWIADGRVTMLEAIPPEALRERVYSHTDALLVTSSWETGPIVAWEAMASGVVLVTSQYTGSGLEGALHHEENCLMFPVDDAGEAARQLTRLSDHELADRLASQGQRLVKDRYTIDKSVAAWAEALDAIRRRSPREGGISWPKPQAAGRLDRLCGVALAESLRSRIGIAFEHRNAGGEWPHSLHASRQGDEEFWNEVRKVETWPP